MTNNLDPSGLNNKAIKFAEVDALIDFLTQLNCIDTSYYRHGRGSIMKTAIAMTDIIFITNPNSTSNKYLIRLQFDNYTKVILFNAWNY